MVNEDSVRYKMKNSFSQILISFMMGNIESASASDATSLYQPEPMTWLTTQSECYSLTWVIGLFRTNFSSAYT
jgi:hypothetical protein